MKILHTVEFYSPSVGGSQEVIRQISEHLVYLGHEVTVATSSHPDRSTNMINGVKVAEFDISGNAVLGFRGDVEHYQRFLLENEFDIMLNYGAQEWAMDLVFPVLDRIPYRKVMIPCGFSRLYDPLFREYFSQMPDNMHQYDHIVCHADDYRDTNFARQQGIGHFTIIPNGASEIEFGRVDTTFRRRYGIPDDIPMLLTVGSHTGAKGHRLCMEAFKRLDAKRAALVIIGNSPFLQIQNPWALFRQSLVSAIRGYNIIQVIKLVVRALLGGVALGCIPDDRILSRWINLWWMGRKRVFLLNPPREDVVAALQEADLFLFGSNIEYSPLVLFEAIASKTPFVSLACGNAAEIVSWSGGGVIAPTIKNDDGNVCGDPNEFANMISDLLSDKSRRNSLADAGYRAWRERFTWEKIALRYEELYLSLLDQ